MIDIGGIIFKFIHDTASRFISTCTSKKFGDWLSKKKSQPESKQAEIKYIQERAKRENRLLSLQEQLAQYKYSEVKISEFSALHQASVSERALQLKQEELELAKARMRQDGQVSAAYIELKKQELHIMHEELIERRKFGYLQLELMRQGQIGSIRLKLKELEVLRDQKNWSGILSRDEMREIFEGRENKHKLLMLVSPPDISKSCPLSFINNLEKDLRNRLKLFFQTYYPPTSDLCPVDFFGKFFTASIFDLQAHQLQKELSLVPTVVIYSDITDQDLFIHAYFGVNNIEIPLSLEWRWKTTQQMFMTSEGNEEESLLFIRNTIVKIYQLSGSFLTDLYYLLINPYHEPRLFSTSENEFPSEWLSSCIDNLLKFQKKRIFEHETELRKQQEKNDEQIFDDTALRRLTDEKNMRDHAPNTKLKNIKGTQIWYEWIERSGQLYQLAYWYDEKKVYKVAIIEGIEPINMGNPQIGLSEEGVIDFIERNYSINSMIDLRKKAIEWLSSYSAYPPFGPFVLHTINDMLHNFLKKRNFTSRERHDIRNMFEKAINTQVKDVNGTIVWYEWIERVGKRYQLAYWYNEEDERYKAAVIEGINQADIASQYMTLSDEGLINLEHEDDPYQFVADIRSHAIDWINNL
ncbi:MAG: hypothetical protein Q3M24_19905 [Candidatus Electrothrix aestuarii]|uniref:Uncharacterized protein n=1 Tax=Candidatus Electrothrix aestuarii TaxID=3062594 RepID=A0AAU8LTC6_9BACT|nr:hypothetical protein [Candidatus Electrothrix aestuarii]